MNSTVTSEPRARWGMRGSSDLVSNLKKAAVEHWWLFLLRGVAALAFGIITLMAPGATLVVLMAFIAAYALVDGIVALVSAFRLRPMFNHWWVLLLQGLVSVGFGVYAMFNPALPISFIVVSVALWMVLASAALFTLAQAQKAMGTSPAWGILGGILSAALAVTALVYPRVAVASVLVLIAYFALVIGVVHLIVAFRVRSVLRNAVA